MNKKSICNIFKNNIIIIFAILISIVGVCGMSSCSNGEITVPKLVGLSQKSAENVLKELGLSYNVERLHSAEVDEGLIIAQSFEENSSVDPDTKIAIIVSTGKQIYFPDLVGESESSANATLGALGLSLSVSKKEYSDKVKSGYVISQSAVVGEEAEKGDVVSVVISKGIQKFSVPNVKSNKLATAKLKIKKVHLKYKVKYEYSSSVAKGKVIKQSISAGKMVYKGTTITLIVSKGKKPAPKTSSTSNYAPQSTTPAKTNSSSTSSKSSSYNGFYVYTD